MRNKITTYELKSILDMAIDLLNSNDSLDIDCSVDQYWTILSTEQFEFSKVPEPGVGSLDDDISHLRRCLEDRSYFSQIDFDKIAAIFKSLS